MNSGNIVIEPVEAPEIEDKAFMDGLVTVEKVGRYAGIFVEDGSDEIVSDVFAITVVNNSDKMLQYAQVVITCGGEEYTFDMSTIPAGARAQVLEKNKKGVIQVRTAHSLNPVPFIIYSKTKYEIKDGAYGLANVAPTVAAIFGIKPFDSWEKSMI